ncbi:AAA family ATPase [Desulfovibrio inopinatus]|uniref:AAA family ATPase n=1 Tax=Desulfovibrio inopinatus TaxID=102109 RepID=UPI00042205C5|nr:AAA family ATPase [Desulfovibrio inopinatus]
MRDQIAVILDIVDPATREIVERVIADVGDIEVLGGGPDATSLFIMEASEDIGADLEQVRSLMESHPDIDVFFISEKMDNDVLLAAMRAGVREFFKDPPDEEELRLALWRFKERREKLKEHVQSKQGMLINVIGAKGGVGTTTLAVNLADSFGRIDEVSSVVLIDMNLPYGEVELFLDLKPKFHWGEVVSNISRLDATYLMSVLTRHPSGLYVLPPPSQLEDLQSATPENIASILEMMRGLFDVIVIDLGMYLDEVTLKVMEVSDTILLTSVQNLTCLANVKRFLEHFRQPDMNWEEKIHIVVNRYLADCDLTVADMEETMEKKSFWQIPNDYKATLDAINQGQTLFVNAPKQPVTKSVEGLARELLPQKEKKKKGLGLFGLSKLFPLKKS